MCASTVRVVGNALLVVGVLVWARPKPAPLVDPSQAEERFATLLKRAGIQPD